MVGADASSGGPQPAAQINGQGPPVERGLHQRKGIVMLEQRHAPRHGPGQFADAGDRLQRVVFAA